jgi:hypothetical protein
MLSHYCAGVCFCIHTGHKKRADRKLHVSGRVGCGSALVRSAIAESASVTSHCHLAASVHLAVCSLYSARTIPNGVRSNFDLLHVVLLHRDESH